MARTVRRAALVTAFVLLAGAVFLAITTRPHLQDVAHDADKAWQPLVPALNTRYTALTKVSDRLAQIGESKRTVVRELDAALKGWRDTAEGSTPGDQADAASRLEALAARTEATVAAAPRLKADTLLAATILAFEATKPPAARITGYNRAVTTYQHTRTGLFDRLVAALDGYDARPTLQLAPRR